MLGARIMANTTSRCSIVTATNPKTVTKELRLASDGSIEKTTTAHVTSGRVKVVQFSHLEEFARVLSNLQTNQCAIYGAPPVAEIDLVTEDAWLAQGRPAGKIPRTLETFSWPLGGGILMLDYDAPKDDSPVMGRDELIALVNSVLGGAISEHGCIWWPSTSSCIFHGEKELAGVKGQRIYLHVADASDIPEAGRLLNQHLWLKGFGRYEVSKSGNLLERPLFDGSVWQTNRIDFAAGAKCHDGLVQRRGAPTIIKGTLNDSRINTRESLPDLTDEEVATVNAHRAAARAKVAEQANAVREAWTAERVKEMSQRSGKTGDAATQEATQIAKRAAESRELMGDWILQIADGSSVISRTVAEVLDDPQRYHGLLTYDPLEPDYDGGRLVGKLFLNSARPCLYSMAHGGATYKLFMQPARIELVKGREREATDALLGVLRRSPDVFDFGTVLVSVGEGDGLITHNEHTLRYVVGGLTQFWRWHKMPNGTTTEVLENPPGTICRSTLALGPNRLLKPLDAVITAPTLRPDGSVLSAAGYDKTTKLLYDAQELPPPIPSHPSRDEALAALERLWKPFKDFPFVDAIDRSVHLAAILTAAVRPSLPTAPGFGYDAPSQGSGKTLLAICIATLTSQQEPSVWPHTKSRDDEEVRKRIFTALRSGHRAIVWDNVLGMFDSASMASMLTSSSYQDRVLGTSESNSVPNRAILLMTGNNLTMGGDMVRRVLICRIDPQTETPFARAFSVDPKALCRADRQNIISSALTLIRYYITQCSSRPGKGRMASFEEWDDWVRQTVICVGQDLAPGVFCDVMDQVHANQAADPESDVMARLLHAWREKYGEEWVQAKTVAHDMTAFSSSTIDLREALSEICFNGITASNIGHALKYRKGRIVDGLRLEKNTSTQGRLRDMSLWRVTEVTIP
jgi:hypothetical protein